MQLTFGIDKKNLTENFLQTAFLKTLLSELSTSIEFDRIEINGSIAYASQNFHSINGTIRDNIVFTREFNQDLYRNVLKMSSLDYDLKELPMNDQTIIDDGGSNLSGGQKARINLARFVTRPHKSYFFFCCLSSNFFQSIVQ